MIVNNAILQAEWRLGDFGNVLSPPSTLFKLQLENFNVPVALAVTVTVTANLKTVLHYYY